MKVLADTHILLWWDSDPEKLGNSAAAVLRDPASEVIFCHASVWEMAIKMKLGKLHLPQTLEEWLGRSVQGNGFLLQPITLPAILKTQELEVHHGDPFDRLLIAQALVLDLPVLSADRQWDAYGVKRIWE